MKKLVVLTGPTAVGKSELSISLAKKINGEIISADSIQVYKHLDIGSAKIKESEMSGIKHYLIDVLEPTADFNVHIFKNMAADAMEEIYKKNKIPIIVGGTGFYIQSVLYDIQFENTDDNHAYRNYLNKICDKKGNIYLYNMLKDVDEVSALAIHPNNVKRIIRALEYYHDTGKPISEHNNIQRNNESPYTFSYLVLNDNREILYERINKRVDKMIAEGLESEVRGLLDMGCNKNMVSMQGIGYKEFIKYIEGKISLEDTVELIKKNTRHFAKRQLTWFRREKNVSMIDINKFDYDKEKILDEILINLVKRNIIKDVSNG